MMRELDEVSSSKYKHHIQLNYYHAEIQFKISFHFCIKIKFITELILGLSSERDTLKQGLLKKKHGESAEAEEARIRREYDRLQQLYLKIDSLAEEKLEIVKKLFFMQENFIRKLDQQIEKTE